MSALWSFVAGLVAMWLLWSLDPVAGMAAAFLGLYIGILMCGNLREE